MTRTIFNIIFACILIASCKESGNQKFNFDYDCNKPLLSTEIELEAVNGSEESLFQIFEDLHNLSPCGIDSVDLEIITEGSILGSLFINMADLKKPQRKSTYQDLIKAYQDFTEKIDYHELRQIVVSREILSTLKIDINQWEKHSLILKNLGISHEGLTEIKLAVQENQGRDITYEELSMEIQRKADEAKFKTEIQNKLMNLSLSEIKELNQKIEKKILVYFTAYGAVNSAKFNDLILTNPQVIDIINSNFQFIELQCDDKKALPKAEIYTGKNGQITTYGKRNTELQREEFKSNSFPCLVKIDSENQYEIQNGYTGLNNLLEFLQN